MVRLCIAMCDFLWSGFCDEIFNLPYDQHKETFHYMTRTFHLVRR